jgi:hypothetical protein
MKADPSGATNYKTKDVGADKPEWLQEQRHRSFGKCYSFQPELKIRQVTVKQKQMANVDF